MPDRDRNGFAGALAGSGEDRRCDTLPVRMNDLPLEKRLKDDEDGSSGFSAVTLVDAIRTATSVDEWSNFGGLVLGCIEADFAGRT